MAELASVAVPSFIDGSFLYFLVSFPNGFGFLAGNSSPGNKDICANISDKRKKREKEMKWSNLQATKEKKTKRNKIVTK